MTQIVLLALDTSTEFCSVALLSANAAAVTAGEPGAELRCWVRHEQTGAVSSTRLLPAIRELFDEAGLALADCDAIAFGSGPGSFTGLRTATGVAQGLAFGLNLPVVPVSTLLACAESARLRDPSAMRVLAALDARMDEIYWADYAWDAAQDEWRAVQSASLDAPERLVLPDVPFTLAGNAAAAFGARLPAVAAARTVDGEALPHALPLAHAALRAFRAGRTVRADQAAPEYVRDKVAQTTAERVAEKAAKAEQAEQAARMAQGATRDVTQHATQGATRDVTQRATQGATRDVTQPATQGATRDVNQHATQGATQGASQEATPDATTGPTTDATERPQQPPPQDALQAAPQDTSPDTRPQASDREGQQ
jgi:tRNA threonylcarbamoyladenosine biosynthesis protein TsaB